MAPRRTYSRVRGCLTSRHRRLASALHLQHEVHPAGRRLLQPHPIHHPQYPSQPPQQQSEEVLEPQLLVPDDKSSTSRALLREVNQLEGHPLVLEEERHRQVEHPERGVAARGPGSGRPRQPIASFDPEPRPVEFPGLLGGEPVQPADDVGQHLDAVFPSSTLLVPLHHMDLDRERATVTSLQGVGGVE